MGLYDRDYMRRDWNLAKRTDSHCETKYCPAYTALSANSDEELSHSRQFRNRLALRLNRIRTLFRKRLGS